MGAITLGLRKGINQASDGTAENLPVRKSSRGHLTTRISARRSDSTACISSTSPRERAARHAARFSTIAEGLRLDADQGKLEQASCHHVRHPGFLKETKPRSIRNSDSRMRARRSCSSPRLKIRRNFPTMRSHTVRSGKTSVRSGIIFGPYTSACRATTPEGVSVLDYSQFLYQRNDLLRSAETIPLRDDTPIYIDKMFSDEHPRSRRLHLGDDLYRSARRAAQCRAP